MSKCVCDIYEVMRNGCPSAKGGACPSLKESAKTQTNVPVPIKSRTVGPTRKKKLNIKKLQVSPQVSPPKRPGPWTVNPQDPSDLDDISIELDQDEIDEFLGKIDKAKDTGDAGI